MLAIPRPLLALAAAGSAALALTACAKTVDADDLEGQLKEQLAPQLGAQADAVSVSCPDDQEIETGATFDCDLEGIGDSPVKIAVKLTDDEGKYEASIPPAELKKLAGSGS